ncbi:MAG TPA: 6-phosphogluconolactonase [Candidatus Sulfotelmatobacter sp.]|jgi:6-phosphogluconolactonase/glucosamine-6-phosphate isomerase/deaminase|nr:6-phosphogluconolactonase [Candidatus Sulfotelmatobacter sp.]
MLIDYLTKHAIRHHTNQMITVCNVQDAEAGVILAKELLYEIVDRRTSLYLSGGSMQVLYKALAKEEQIEPGAVGLIDERFGKPMHATSNEKMIKDTGFLRYLQMRNMPFYSVLQAGKSREEAAISYDERVRSLHAIFQKNIGLIGIGPDGHISSIIPNRPDFHNPWFDSDRQYLLVSEFNDKNSQYKERVGMTFLGLSMLDQMLILAFGESKQKMFNKLFEEGKEEEIPARFFKRPEIAKKTLLITDQTV